MAGTDRGARTTGRARRQFQRTSVGDGILFGNGFTFDDGNGELNLNLYSLGGLGFNGSALTIDLRDTTPGLELVASGIGVLLNGSSLTLSASGLSVTTPAGQWTVTDIKTGAYTASWGELVRVDASGGAFTVTLPTAASNAGAQIMVKEVAGSSNVVTVDGDGSETIDGSATAEIASALSAFLFISDGTNVMVA